jgi:hypothetical protein
MNQHPHREDQVKIPFQVCLKNGDVETVLNTLMLINKLKRRLNDLDYRFFCFGKNRVEKANIPT